MISSNEKHIKIFGVPMDLGSKPLGVKMGPAAIRYAGLSEALAFNNFQFDDYGDIHVNNFSGKAAIHEIVRVVQELATLVEEAINDRYIPIVLGGDHSVAVGSIAGASKTAEKLGLLWLDCHPDANTPESSPSGNIHGMPVAIALGFGDASLVECHGFYPKVKPENVCIVGAKDIDKAEQIFLEDLGVKMFTLHDIAKYGIVKVFDEAYEIVTNQCDKVHVSFDIDVLDPVIAPGTGILSRGGLSNREISYIMKTLGEKDVVTSIDLIEINPLLDIRNQTSELAVELLLSCIGGRYGDYERNYLIG